MRFLEQGSRALIDEARRIGQALRDWQLALLLGLMALLLLLATQAPLYYTIQVGQEDGIGGDLPLLSGFFTTERDIHGDFRWTTDRASIHLPGIGQRSLQLTLKVFPIGPEIVEKGPRELELWASDQLIARLPVQYTGAVYRVLVPPPTDGSGDHLIEIRSTTFIPTGDQRSIGSPVDRITVAALAGPTIPPWRSMLAWLAATLLAWLAVRRIGFNPKHALMMLSPVVLLVGVAALLDPPRLAMGYTPALIALGLAYLLVILLDANADGLVLAGLGIAVLSVVLVLLVGTSAPSGRIALPSIVGATATALILSGGLRPGLQALAQRLLPSTAPHVWRWLLLFAWLTLAMRFGGKIYPDSMRGDIGFHSNRYDFLVSGWALQLSLNRGVQFPYPTAFYLLLAPFSLLGLPQRVLLRLGGALLDALSPLLIFALVACVLQRNKRLSSAANNIALGAAWLYSFSAAGFMTTWWNFSTHIFTQFAHLLLLTALVLFWPRLNQPPTPGRTTWQRLIPPQQVLPLSVLIVLQVLVYLGHFGFWMNMSLLGAGGLAILLWLAWRKRVDWHIFRLMFIAFVLAEVLAVLLVYSSFSGLFLQQLQATATGGLTGLAGREAVDRAILWRTLWDAGFGMHFGFFPIPMALAGLLLLVYRLRNTQRAWQSTTFLAVVLMLGTFVIGTIFAVLPFLSGSTLSTRWLMFALWAVAFGAALTAHTLWRMGRAGRLLVYAMGGYVAWNTLAMWLMALAWRVRPPEPF